MLGLPLWLLISGGALAVIVLGKRYFGGGACSLSPDLTGKVAIVTGSNTGIGYYTALRLAQLGAKVVMACRDATRANAALEKIKNEAKDAKIEFIKIDLTSSSSIKEFVDVFKTKYSRLDLLINNAGLVSDTRQLTKEGVEKTFSANHLGHFLLTSLLKDYLIKSAPSRVINVSSKASFKGKIDWDDLMLEKNYSVMTAYKQSKLANVIFSSEFNRRYESQGVKAVSVHPGVVTTEIWRDLFKKPLTAIPITICYPLIWLMFKSSIQGAQTTLYCALVDNDKLQGGKYYADCIAVKKMAKGGDDEEFGKKLWAKSLELLNLKEY